MMFAAEILVDGGETILFSIAGVAGVAAIIGLMVGCISFDEDYKFGGFLTMGIGLIIGAIVGFIGWENSKAHFKVEEIRDEITESYESIYDVHFNVDGHNVSFRNADNEPCEGEYIRNEREGTTLLVEVICDDGRITPYEEDPR